jgi:GcrA cell cycle regulator
MAAVWTKEATTELIRLHHDGLSASSISEALLITRNAIIGKLFRLGYATPKPQRRARPQMPRPAPVRSLTQAPRARSRRKIPAKIEPVMPHLALDFAPNLDAIGAAAAHVSLHPEQCKWPSGDPKTDFRFACAAQRLPDRPYCAAHTALAAGQPASRLR